MLTYNLLGEVMNYLLLVNKKNSLDKLFIPSNMEVVVNRKGDKPDLVLLLDKKVHKWFKKMVRIALKDGFDIICDSAYRSYLYQMHLYKDLISNGEDISYLAKPGESEHQTGLCIDIAAYQNGKYVDKPALLKKEYAWLENNAHKYGFILRYPLGKENVTGYPYEPWHYRYVGRKHAKNIWQEKITLEEYLEKLG